MLIASFQKLTLLDYPGHLAALIFTPGCNFRCPFCHNPELIDPEKIKKLILIPEDEVLKDLKRRKKLLEGVVITGGEPTLQKDLKAFIAKLKALGYLVKLDTNGTNPKILEKLIKDKLIDFIAMDIKGSLDKYEQITNQKVNVKNIEESIKLIMNSGLDYEFRTTVLPVFHQEEDFKKIGEWIKGAKKYCLQQFEPKITLDINFKNEKKYSSKELKNIAESARNYVKEVDIRGIN